MSQIPPSIVPIASAAGQSSGHGPLSVVVTPAMPPPRAHVWTFLDITTRRSVSRHVGPQLINPVKAQRLCLTRLPSSTMTNAEACQALIKALTDVESMPPGSPPKIARAFDVPCIEEYTAQYVDPANDEIVSGNVLQGFDVRKEAIRAYPWLAVRAFEQGQVDIVFHAKSVASTPKKIWECPHCLETFQGQANLLRRHFIVKKCPILEALDKEIERASR
ncbi:hypothetical protein CYLTODRAFT_419362 [Cylindrobasidium torrendii FP15055 ss-10]|uniref:Uncharacterized protein n=1 Tax=Cylindrobasidium torrendii FP15055 ss-10 TaxID=1314674 RepID=A0A0D7BL21_9AGAR|nr:hypothetical protein CYLTODRAFT_419362 [Cylindrobasidium torrendii FP15055 ss-10]